MQRKKKEVAILRKELCILKDFKKHNFNNLQPKSEWQCTHKFEGKRVYQKHLKTDDIIDLHDGFFCRRPFSMAFFAVLHFR